MENVQEIIKLIKEDKISNARKRIYKDFKDNPRLFYYYTALTYCAQNQYLCAAQYFDMAIKSGLNNHIAFYNLAVSYMEIKEYNKAEESFLNCIKLKKDYSKGYLNLIALLNSQGENKRAYRILKMATIYCKDYDICNMEKEFYVNIIDKLT